VVGLPVGLNAFAAGLGSQNSLSPLAATYNAELGAGGGDRGNSYDKVLQVLELENLLNERQLQQQQAAVNAENLDAYVQSQPQERRALARFAPKVLAKEQAQAAFAGQLTEDQRIDNELAERRFQFDQTKFNAEQALKAEDKGKFSEAEGRYYVTEVGKADKAFASSLERYQSGVKSLAARNATGDKAALVHLARLLSDEALQEADVQRQVSEGVLPSYFESAWNAALGKDGLKPFQRREIRQQLGRELGTKYDSYDYTYARLSDSISPAISNSEKARVLGDRRLLPQTVQRQRELEQLAQEEEDALVGQAQQQQQAQGLSQIVPGQISLQQAENLTEEQLDALPFETLMALQQQLDAQKAAADQVQEEQARQTVLGAQQQSLSPYAGQPGPFR